MKTNQRLRLDVCLDLSETPYEMIDQFIGTVETIRHVSFD